MSIGSITFLLFGAVAASDDAAWIPKTAPSDTCPAEPGGGECQEFSASQEEYQGSPMHDPAGFYVRNQPPILIQKRAAMLKLQYQADKQAATLSAAKSLGTLNAYWNMDEEDLSTSGILDVSGNGYTLTRQINPARTTPCFTVAGAGLGGSTALKFVDDTTNVGDRSWADTPSVLPFSHTVSLWFQRPVGCCVRRDKILRLFYTSGVTFLQVRIHGTQLRVDFWDSSNSKLKELKQDWPLATNLSYKHVAAVIGTDSLSVYVDGQFVNTGTNSGISTLDKSGNMSIQLGTGQDANQFDGEVDDVRLYSEALSATAITQLYNDGPLSSVYNYKPSGSVSANQAVAYPWADISGTCFDVEPGVTASWVLASQPAGGAAAVDNPSSENTLISFGGAAVDGEYVLTLTCSDGEKTSDPANTTVILLPSPSTWFRFEEPLGMRSITDDAANGGPLILARWKSSSQPIFVDNNQHPFADLESGNGLAGGGAIRFPGRSYATASNVAPFRSVSLWMKPDVGCCLDSSGKNRIIRIAEATRSTTGTSYFLLRVHGGQLRAEVKSTTGSLLDAKLDYAAATSEAWVHVAVVFDTQKVALFLDGVEVATSGINTVVLANLGSEMLTFQLGTGGTAHQFRGLLDDVRLYPFPLTDTTPVTVSDLNSSSTSGGMLPGEVAPIRADAGPTLTLWLPTGGGSALVSALAGSCEGGAGGVTSSWALTSSPVGASSSSVTIASPTQAASSVSVDTSATVGDYLLTLTCTEGLESRTSEVKLVVFPPHTNQSSSILQSYGGLNDLPGVGGSPSAPVGMWLFEGDLSDQGSGNHPAIPTQVKGSQPVWGYTEGRFGQGLELNCTSTQCVQLNLSNAETTPWTAMSMSLWFKSSKHKKLELLRKYCGFHMGTPEMTEDWANTWHHYVTVFDNNIYKKYLDGVLVYIATSNHSDSENEGLPNGGVRTATDASDEMWLGFKTLAADCDWSGKHPSYGFHGVVDEILVFDYMITNEEIDILYKQGAAALVTRPAGNPYSRSDMPKSLLQTFYPDLPLDEDYTGFFKQDPSALSAPDTYVHPRLCFSPEELPAVRERLRNAAAGRVAMENLRVVLGDSFPYAELETRNFTFEELRKFPDGENSYVTQLMILESFRVLIDGDRTVAERLGQQLDYLADALLPHIEAFNQTVWKSGNTRLDETDTWKDYMHDSVLRPAVAFMYDFLYPYLPQGTRDKVRTVIAKATQNTWTIGMDSPMAYKALTSNWIPLVSFDLALNLLAIKGEDGFDQGVFERMVKVFHGWTTLGVSRISGASFEGGGKNALGGTTLLLMAKHGYPQYIASAGVRKHTTDFLLHTMLPNGLFFEDDKWGQLEAKPDMGDTLGVKFAFPDDNVIDFVYRMSARDKLKTGILEDPRDYNELTWLDSSFFVYNNILLTIMHALDFSGPADILEHEALATAGQPRTKVFTDLGLVIARSAWADREAAWFGLNVRSIPGGHAASARGEFMFHALNETWAFYPHSGDSAATELHSVILVDGDVNSQSSSPGKFLSYVDKEEATWASCDLQYAYSKAEWSYEPPNYFLVEPFNSTEYPWADLPWNIQPQWYTGIQKGYQATKVNKSNELTGELSSFQKAFRTGGLVRSGSMPYALIFDDFQKDSSNRTYTWQMALKPHSSTWDEKDRKWSEVPMDRSNITANSNDIILEGTDTSSRLLVRLLPGSSASDSIAINQADIENPKLEIKSTAAHAKFRVLLYPMRPADQAPTTSWDATSSILTIGTDELLLSTSAAGLTMVTSLTQNGGTPIIFGQQAVEEKVHVESS